MCKECRCEENLEDSLQNTSIRPIEIKDLEDGMRKLREQGAEKLKKILHYEPSETDGTAGR